MNANAATTQIFLFPCFVLENKLIIHCYRMSKLQKLSFNWHMSLLNSHGSIAHCGNILFDEFPLFLASPRSRSRRCSSVSSSSNQPEITQIELLVKLKLINCSNSWSTTMFRIFEQFDEQNSIHIIQDAPARYAPSSTAPPTTAAVTAPNATAVSFTWN